LLEFNKSMMLQQKQKVRVVWQLKK
jgi:hypothetical protein